MQVFQESCYHRESSKVFWLAEGRYEGLEPYSFVEKMFTWKHIELGPICYETLLKFMHCVTKEVEKITSKTIPDILAFVSDSWSLRSGYIIVVFASFLEKSFNDLSQFMMLFSSFENEASSTADERKKCFEYVVEYYDKS